MNHGGRDRETPLHAGGHFPRDVIRVQVEFPDHVLNPLLEMLSAEPIGAAEKLQVLPDGEIPVKRKLLGDVTHMTAGFGARRPEIETIHLHETACRGEKPAENPEGHRFPGAVRAEEPEDFARFHRERGAFHGGEVPELPDEVLHDNDWRDVAV